MNPHLESGPHGNGKIVVGLDIGGSKTHGIRIDGGQIAGDETAGSANVQNVDTDTAGRNLERLMSSLRASDADEVYVGAGGIDTDKDAANLTLLIAPHAPRATITVVHDTRLILAAAGRDAGIAVIAGTGSAVWGVDHTGDEARSGGWGYLLGDEGSGYWFSRQAVRHALRELNLGRPADELTMLLLANCGLSQPEQLISHFHTNHDRRYWAQLSSVVFTAAAAGHQPSHAIIEEGGRQLADQILQVSRRLALTAPVVLGGGLGAHQPALLRALNTQLSQRGLPTADVLTTEPVFGVLHLAGVDLVAAGTGQQARVSQ